MPSGLGLRCASLALGMLAVLVSLNVFHSPLQTFSEERKQFCPGISADTPILSLEENSSSLEFQWKGAEIRGVFRGRTASADLLNANESEGNSYRPRVLAPKAELAHKLAAVHLGKQHRLLRLNATATPLAARGDEISRRLLVLFDDGSLRMGDLSLEALQFNTSRRILSHLVVQWSWTTMDTQSPHRAELATCWRQDVVCLYDQERASCANITTGEKLWTFPRTLSYDSMIPKDSKAQKLMHNALALRSERPALYAAESHLVYCDENRVEVFDLLTGELRAGFSELSSARQQKSNEERWDIDGDGLWDRVLIFASNPRCVRLLVETRWRALIYDLSFPRGCESFHEESDDAGTIHGVVQRLSRTGSAASILVGDSGIPGHVQSPAWRRRRGLGSDVVLLTSDGRVRLISPEGSVDQEWKSSSSQDILGWSRGKPRLSPGLEGRGNDVAMVAFLPRDVRSPDGALLKSATLLVGIAPKRTDGAYTPVIALVDGYRNFSTMDVTKFDRIQSRGLRVTLSQGEQFLLYVHRDPAVTNPERSHLSEWMRRSSYVCVPVTGLVLLLWVLAEL